MTRPSVSWQVPMPQGSSAQDLAGASTPREEAEYQEHSLLRASAVSKTLQSGHEIPELREGWLWVTLFLGTWAPASGAGDSFADCESCLSTVGGARNPQAKSKERP